VYRKLRIQPRRGSGWNRISEEDLFMERMHRLDLTGTPKLKKLEVWVDNQFENYKAYLKAWIRQHLPHVEHAHVFSTKCTPQCNS
jgi:hypothetical protein